MRYFVFYSIDGGVSLATATRFVLASLFSELTPILHLWCELFIEAREIQTRGTCKNNDVSLSAGLV